MFLDAQNLFDPGTTPIAGAQNATVAAPNVIDLQVARNVGVGATLYVFATVLAALVGANAKVQVDVQTSPDNATWTTTQNLGTFAALALVGTKLFRKIQIDGMNDRYARVQYTILTAALTSAQVKCGFTTDIDNFVPYKNNTQITG